MQSFPTTSAKNNVIRYNLITGQGGNELDNAGIETDGYTSDNQIYGNVIWGNGGPCIDLNGTETTLVYNNTCYGNQLTRPSTYKGEIKLSDQANSTSSTPNNVIENNIAYATQSDSYAIYVDNVMAGKTDTYANNLFYGSEQANWYFWNTSAGSNLAMFNKLSGVSGNLNADPLFVNTSGDQLWLQGGSPAIDEGTNLGSPYNFALLPSSVWPNSVVTGNQNSYGTGWEVGAYIFTGQTVQ